MDIEPETPTWLRSFHSSPRRVTPVTWRREAGRSTDKTLEVCETQKAEVVLAVLRRQSTQSKDFVFDRLYRNLFNPDFYMLAYSNLYAKEGK
jgi:hypothetical protein